MTFRSDETWMLKRHAGDSKGRVKHGCDCRIFSDARALLCTSPESNIQRVLIQKVLARAGDSGSVLRIQPPLIVEIEQIDKALDILDRLLKEAYLLI